MADQVKYTQKLKGDKVLVIGGSAGIGFAVAEALVENGCTVIISSSNQDRVNKKIELLKTSYPSAKDRISGHACNLADEENLEANVKGLFEKVGTGIDHIVHTAGDALAVKKIDEIDMKSIKAAGMVRFYSPLFVAKYAKAYLNPGPKSSITFTTGSVSERPISNWSVVNSYATGLQGMTRGLALDLKPIRVNLVSPGAVDTELWDAIVGDNRQSMFDAMAQKLPVGAIGKSEDVAESYLYFMKDHNITGTMISTSGGMLLV